MCSELKIVETLDINSKILSKFPCHYSDTDFLSILTKHGVLIARLSALRDNNLPSVSFHKQMIQPSTFILSVNVDIKLETFFESLSQADTYESVLQGDLSAGLDVCKKTVFNVISSRWSCTKVIGTHAVIAILNDAGSLDIYGKTVDACLLMRYQHLINVTMEGIEHYKHEWKCTKLLSSSEKLVEFKRRLSIQTPTAFCWSHIVTVNNTRFCFLIVSYLNGRIAFWKFKCLKVDDFMDATLDFVADVKTKLQNITTMHWKKSNNAGLLFIGNYTGQIISIPIENIAENSIKFGEIIDFCSTENIKVEYIDSVVSSNNYFVFIIKGTYLIIYLFNNEGTIIDSCNFCAGNLNINDIEHFEDKLLILCETGALKELKITTDNKKIFIHWRHIYLNINWTLKKACGMFFTRNKVLFGMITDACRMFNMKEEKENFNLIMLCNKAKDPIDILLNNPTNSLRNYIDCLEVARITAILNKELICQRLPPNINYDNSSLLNLKTYYYFAKVSEFVYEQLESIHSYSIIPSTDIYRMIEIKIAIHYMKVILEELERTKTLNKNKKHCLSQLNRFLKEIVMQDILIKLKLGNTYIGEIFDVISRSKDLDFGDLPTTCIVCDNNIIGSSCMNTHYDNRCAISMIQIINPRYVCPFCKRAISEEVAENIDILECPFCDVEMEALMKVKIIVDPVLINCHSDCLPLEIS